MDRRNYDSKAMGLFDTIGSYFVDALYNNHYLIARDIVRRGAANNITDAYRTTVINYMNGSSRDDLFKIIVYKLHEFYQKNSGFGTIVLSEFQNKVLSQFIPAEYYQDFTDRHKDKTLKEIIVRTVNEFGAVALSPNVLRRIIDDHLNRDNITLLQDHIVDIFILQREEYYTKFAQEISRKNAGGTVDKGLLDKLKLAYVDEKRKCCELMADKERAANIVGQLIDKIKALEAANLMLKEEAERHSLRRIQGDGPVEHAPRTNESAPRTPSMYLTRSTENSRAGAIATQQTSRSDTNIRGRQVEKPIRMPREKTPYPHKANQNTTVAPAQTSSASTLGSETIDTDIMDISSFTTDKSDTHEHSEQDKIDVSDDDSSGPDDEEIHRRQREAIANRQQRLEYYKANENTMKRMLTDIETDQAIMKDRYSAPKPSNIQTSDDMAPALRPFMRPDTSSSLPMDTIDGPSSSATYSLDDDPWVQVHE